MPEQYRYSLPVKAGDQRQLGELTGAAWPPPPGGGGGG
ncbi:hypothetical protein, partial [Klebsiella sp. MS 92-3]